MPELRLTREQRSALFARETPRIAGDGVCPVKPGDVVRLSSKVSLLVLQVRRPKAGGWSLQYELRDTRDRVLILRRTPRIENPDLIRRSFDQHGFPVPLDAEEQERAALESAYTTMPTSLSDAGEAVDPRELEAINRRRRDMQGVWRRERQVLVASLQRLSSDPHSRLAAANEIRGLQRQIEALDRKLTDAA